MSMKITKRYLIMTLLVIILSLFSFCNNNQNAELWYDEMYAAYNYKQFYSYHKANEKIDFSNISYPLLQAAIFYETNVRRSTNNRPLFKYSPYLKRAAQMHAEDMSRLNFFSHNSPIQGRTTAGDRLRLVGHNANSWGENIIRTFGKQYKSGTQVPSFDGIPPHTYISFAKSALDSWMNSPGHRANILRQNFNYLGAGVMLDDINGPIYFHGVQVFSGERE